MSSTTLKVANPDWSLVEEFFYHINERHRIYIKRKNGDPPPWTRDRILRNWFFTNVKRDFDRTTVFIKENFYDKHKQSPAEEILLNCGIFRYFCNTDFIKEIGWQREWRPDFLIDTARSRRERGLKSFTNAFVITNNGIKKPKEEVVVGCFLEDYKKNIPNLVKVIEKTNRWEKAIECLNTVHGFSDFMSKEVILDVMLTPVLENAKDKYDWSPAGPGAKIGIHMIWHIGDVEYNKVRNHKGNFLPYMEFLFNIKDEYLEPHAKELDWTMHDIQFALCEFQKRLNIKSKGKGKRRYNYEHR